MKSFRLITKALAILVLLFAVTTFVMAGYSAWFLDRSLTAQFEGKGKAIANGIAGASVEILLFRDAATVQATIEQYLEEGRAQGIAYIFVVDEKDNIISHTFFPGIPDEARGLRGARHEPTIRPIRFADGDFIDVAAPILASEVGFVHVGMDRALIRATVHAAILHQTGLMCLLFLLSTVSAYFMVERLSRPLRRLTSYARKAAAADAAAPGHQPLPPAPVGDEVAQLAHAFEHMVEEVSSREQGLRRAQEELKTLNETLEQRVAERSAAVAQRARELAQANERMEREMAERKQAEAELEQERHLLTTLMDNIPDSIYFKDQDSKFVRVNRALARRFDLGDAAAAIGKTDFDFFTEEHARPALEDEQEVMRSDRPLVAKEEKETWADGRQRWVVTTKMPLRDPQGIIIGTFGISRDITIRKEAQIGLEASERRYRQLTEASLDGIVVADQNQRILVFNPAAQRAFGYTADEVVGKSLTVLMPPELQEPHQRGFERFVRTRQGKLVGRSVELRGRRKDGAEFPLEVSLNALDLGGELQFLGTIRDLTERNRLRAMMAQTEKLASIGQLSAGVAHEINNPLAYVGNNLVVLERDSKAMLGLVDLYEQGHEHLTPELLGRVQAMAEDIDLSYIRENLERLLTRTRNGVERVARIVHSMRGLARTDTHELQSVRIPELVDMSLEMIRGQLRRRDVQIEIDYPPDLPSVRCVPTQISQVLLNMLVNAQQAIESTGRPDGRVRIGARVVDDELALEIADNGSGIAPEARSRLFDPFFTTKPVGEGTGLGLSIAHSIITGHGGRIEVDSKPGVGTTFRIYLPLEAV